MADVNMNIHDGQAFYAHEISINFSPGQMVLDFKNITPRIDPRNKQGPTFVLVHNVVTLDPYHAKQFHTLLGTSLGLFGERDKDKSAFRIFLELLKAAKRGQPLSSDDLAEMLGLTRGTVIHHINNLITAGIVVYDGKRYWLREPKLEVLLDEIRRDLDRTIDDLKRTAKEIDETLRA